MKGWLSWGHTECEGLPDAGGGGHVAREEPLLGANLETTQNSSDFEMTPKLVTIDV